MDNKWITDRLPTWHDADKDCEVIVPYKQDRGPGDGLYVDYRVVVPGQPWWSENAARAAQPTPPPVPAPTRWVTAMASDAEFGIIAACNDGTTWRIDVIGTWHPIAPIPQPEPNA